MNNRSHNEVRVGALIILGLILVVMAFLAIGDKEGLLSKKYDLYAEFDDVGGLAVGSPVRLGGMKVGSVENIKFAEDIDRKVIVVKMSIESGNFVRIREDSEARLGSMGLLGDKTIDLSIGSPDREALGPGDYVKTATSFGFDQLISETEPAIEDIKSTAANAKEISWKINYGEGSLSKILNDPRLYTNLDSLLLIWSSLSAKIDKGKGNLASLVNDPELYDNTTAFFRKFSEFIDKVNEGQGTLGKLTTDEGLYHHTDSTLIAVKEAVEQINTGDGTLGQLLYNAALYDRLNSTLSALDSLLVDIKKNPKKYVKFSIF